MEPSEARDHLQWVDGILRTADQSLHLPPATLIAWGVVAAAFNAAHQAAAMGMSVPRDGSFQLPMILAAIAISIWAAARTPAGRQTLVDRNAGIVFGVVFAVLMLINLTMQDRVVPFRAMALFWCVAYSIALLVVGIQSSRPLWVGGMILLFASVTAGFVPAWFDGVLALGWALGFVGPGVVLAWGRRNGRPSAI